MSAFAIELIRLVWFGRTISRLELVVPRRWYIVVVDGCSIGRLEVNDERPAHGRRDEAVSLELSGVASRHAGSVKAGHVLCERLRIAKLVPLSYLTELQDGVLFRS